MTTSVTQDRVVKAARKINDWWTVPEMASRLGVDKLGYICRILVRQGELEWRINPKYNLRKWRGVKTPTDMNQYRARGNDHE